MRENWLLRNFQETNVILVTECTWFWDFVMYDLAKKGWKYLMYNAFEWEMTEYMIFKTRKGARASLISFASVLRPAIYVILSLRTINHHLRQAFTKFVPSHRVLKFS